MLNEFEKFYIIRPLLKNHKYDRFGFPIISHQKFPPNINWNEVEILNYKNATSHKIKNCNKTIITKFAYDKELDRDYNSILKNIPSLSKFLAVCTPDFSIYPNMNENIIRYNTFRNRYVGCLYEDCGIIPIPTISWSNRETYDICFGGVEEGMPVVIVSTLGCQKSQDVFLSGYDEMMKRIKPKLVLVFGKPIRGMYGKLKIFEYYDSFNNSNYNKKESLIKLDTIIDVKKDGYYGW